MARFTSQLKGWWDKHLTNIEKSQILEAIKLNANGGVVIDLNGDPIFDVVNTLIFTITKHFIRYPNLWKDKLAKLLSNLKCRTFGDFAWYKNAFFSRIYSRSNSN